MAAADPHEVSHQRLEDTDCALMIAFGERLDAARELDRGPARRQFAVGDALLQLGQSRFQLVAAGCRRDQRVMDVGKVRTSLREVFFAVSGDILPMRLQTGLAGQGKPPQQRGTIGKNVQRRVWPVSGFDLCS